MLDREAVPLSSIADEVQKITSQPVKIVDDSSSAAETQNAAYEILAPGGQLILVWPFSVDEARRTSDKEVVEVFGSVQTPQNRAAGIALYRNLTALLQDGDIKVSRLQLWSSSCI